MSLNNSECKQDEAAAQAPREVEAARFSRVPPRVARDRRLSAGDLRILIAICKHVNPEGWSWPSQETLAEEAAYPRGKISERTQRLARFGHIEIHTARKKNGEFGVARYRVIFARDPSGGGMAITDAAPPLKVARPAPSEGGTDRAPSGGGSSIPDSEHPIEQPLLAAAASEVQQSGGKPGSSLEALRLTQLVSHAFKMSADHSGALVRGSLANLQSVELQRFLDQAIAHGLKRDDMKARLAELMLKQTTGNQQHALNEITSTEPDKPAYEPIFTERTSEMHRRHWRTAAEALHRQIGGAACKSWFGQSEIDIDEVKALTIRAPTRFIRDHLRNHLDMAIQAAWGRRFEIDLIDNANTPKFMQRPKTVTEAA